MGYEPVTIREAAQLEVLLFVGFAFVVSLLIIYWGFQTYQFGRLIRDTPPESIQSVAMGRTEIQGEIVPNDRVYDQPFAEGQCVYCEYEVEEYKKSGDDDGKSWQTIDSGLYGTSFHVDDGTGRILVAPNDETIYEISEDYQQSITVGGGESPPDPIAEFLSGPDVSVSDDEDSGRIRSILSGLKRRISGDDDDDTTPAEDPTATEGPATESSETDDHAGDGDTSSATDTDSHRHVRRQEIASVSGTGNKRRYSQKVIPVEETIYVYGGTQRRDLDDTVGVDVTDVIRTDPSTGEFIISDKGEFSLASDYTKRSMMYMGSGILTSVMILALLAQILVTGPVYGIDAALP